MNSLRLRPSSSNLQTKTTHQRESVYISAKTMADLDKTKATHASGSIFGLIAVSIPQRAGNHVRLANASPSTQ